LRVAYPTYALYNFCALDGVGALSPRPDIEDNPSRFMKKLKRKLFDPQTFLALVGAGKAILNLTKGRIIFTQGDAANNVFYIQSGKVKMTVVSEQGKEAVVGILEAGQFFGEGCLNGHSVRIATAKTLEPSVITSIAKKTMLGVS
jgi:CRP/FNR family cyclic AMP-dependent transcriptional regulator